MAEFTVRKLFRYDVEVIVEADSEEDALEKAKSEEGFAYSDDTLMDMYCVGSKK